MVQGLFCPKLAKTTCKFHNFEVGLISDTLMYYDICLGDTSRTHTLESRLGCKRISPPPRVGWRVREDPGGGPRLVAGLTGPKPRSGTDIGEMDLVD